MSVRNSVAGLIFFWMLEVAAIISFNLKEF